MSRLFTPESHPVIAIDLDSTIWDVEHPTFGTPFPNAIKTINHMIDAGYEVIIWSSRGGENLSYAIRTLEQLHGLKPGIKFNAHSNYFLSRYPVQSPKVGAHVYIDDKAYGSPFFGDKEPNWFEIEKHFLG